ncbi:integrin beta-1-binding protein 1 isoform X2 [Pelodiscus sinensis]|uniref:integrin beta-1-binding protein 1 isoform X2 n=1 Tax=Pelodiscus sinensis TaxID=13735 RepID=UPI003F6BB1F7
MFRKGKKRHSSSSSQSSEISTKSKSVDSSLGGLSRSSTVASLDTDSTKSSGQSNSISDTCAEFRVKYVGAIEKLKFDESKSLEGPLDLINYIDVAQQDGKLPFVPAEEEFIMGVSKYGIKVSTSDQYRPLWSSLDEVGLENVVAFHHHKSQPLNKSTYLLQASNLILPLHCSGCFT